MQVDICFANGQKATLTATSIKEVIEKMDRSSPSVIYINNEEFENSEYPTTDKGNGILISPTNSTPLLLETIKDNYAKFFKIISAEDSIEFYQSTAEQHFDISIAAVKKPSSTLDFQKETDGIKLIDSKLASLEKLTLKRKPWTKLLECVNLFDFPTSMALEDKQFILDNKMELLEEFKKDKNQFNNYFPNYSDRLPGLMKTREYKNILDQETIQLDDLHSQNSTKTLTFIKQSHYNDLRERVFMLRPWLYRKWMDMLKRLKGLPPYFYEAYPRYSTEYHSFLFLLNENNIKTLSVIEMQDISRFYYTLYTHSLCWVLVGKSYAQKNTMPHLYFNVLDTVLRDYQSKSSHGIMAGSALVDHVIEFCMRLIDVNILESFDIKDIQLLRLRRYGDKYHFCRPKEGYSNTLRDVLKEYKLDFNKAKEKIIKVIDYNSPMSALCTLKDSRYDQFCFEQFKLMESYHFLNSFSKHRIEITKRNNILSLLNAASDPKEMYTSVKWRLLKPILIYFVTNCLNNFYYLFQWRACYRLHYR